MDRVFFVNSGSAAVESEPMQNRRCYHLANNEEQRHKVIARHWACHGTTLGAILAISPPLVADEAGIDDLLSRVDQVLDHIGGWLKTSQRRFQVSTDMEKTQ